jgi:hypothetical protein
MRRRPVAIWGSHHAILTRMHPLSRDQEEPGPITGDIFRYTDIDAEANWFNTATNKFATDDELENIRIPENLKPNSSRFSYIFFPETHLLFYEGYYDSNTLAPTRAEAFFQSVFADEDLVEKFGAVDVTHYPMVDRLEDALALPIKTRLEVHLSRPNPDSLQDAEGKYLRRMHAWSVASVEQQYSAVDGTSIEVDEELTTLTKVAAKNGAVSIKGRDQTGEIVEFSTKQHPWRHKEMYNSDSVLAFDLFAAVATRFNDLFGKK